MRTFAQSAVTRTAVSRTEVIAAAVANNPRTAIVTADRAIASADVRAARQWDNPMFGASFTKDAPQQHYTVDLPLDAWWLRAPRVSAAESGRDATALRLQFEIRSIALDADTAYTRAQLAMARSRLSARTAGDADSLLVLARVRRDAGDASQLDVELASVFAGQARNLASADSLAARAALLAMQTMMGLAADAPSISVSDSLTLERADDDGRTTTSPLALGAVAREVQAAESRLLAEQRRRFGAPSLSLGVETANPDGPAGALPTVGLSIPFPLFHRNEAGIAGARAELARAQAVQALTRLESSAAVLAARRDADAARARAERSATLVASADRITAMSLLAYREGASTLLVVLEAQRTARETLLQYFEDVAASRVATSVLRLLTTPVTTPAPETRP